MSETISSPVNQNSSELSERKVEYFERPAPRKGFLDKVRGYFAKEGTIGNMLKGYFSNMRENSETQNNEVRESIGSQSYTGQNENEWSASQMAGDRGEQQQNQEEDDVEVSRMQGLKDVWGRIVAAIKKDEVDQLAEKMKDTVPDFFFMVDVARKFQQETWNGGNIYQDLANLSEDQLNGWMRNLEQTANNEALGESTYQIVALLLHGRISLEEFEQYRDILEANEWDVDKLMEVGKQFQPSISETEGEGRQNPLQRARNYVKERRDEIREIRRKRVRLNRIKAIFDAEGYKRIPDRKNISRITEKIDNGEANDIAVKNLVSVYLHENLNEEQRQAIRSSIASRDPVPTFELDEGEMVSLPEILSEYDQIQGDLNMTPPSSGQYTGQQEWSAGQMAGDRGEQQQSQEEEDEEEQEKTGIRSRLRGAISGLINRIKSTVSSERQTAVPGSENYGQDGEGWTAAQMTGERRAENENDEEQTENVEDADVIYKTFVENFDPQYVRERINEVRENEEETPEIAWTIAVYYEIYAKYNEAASGIKDSLQSDRGLSYKQRRIVRDLYETLRELDRVTETEIRPYDGAPEYTSLHDNVVFRALRRVQEGIRRPGEKAKDYVKRVHENSRRRLDAELAGFMEEIDDDDIRKVVKQYYQNPEGVSNGYLNQVKNSFESGSDDVGVDHVLALLLCKKIGYTRQVKDFFRANKVSRILASDIVSWMNKDYRWKIFNDDRKAWVNATFFEMLQSISPNDIAVSATGERNAAGREGADRSERWNNNVFIDQGAIGHATHPIGGAALLGLGMPIRLAASAGFGGASWAIRNLISARTSGEAGSLSELESYWQEQGRNETARKMLKWSIDRSSALLDSENFQWAMRGLGRAGRTAMVLSMAELGRNAVANIIEDFGDEGDSLVNSIDSAGGSLDQNSSQPLGGEGGFGPSGEGIAQGGIEGSGPTIEPMDAGDSGPEMVRQTIENIENPSAGVENAVEVGNEAVDTTQEVLAQAGDSTWSVYVDKLADMGLSPDSPTVNALKNMHEHFNIFENTDLVAGQTGEFFSDAVIQNIDKAMELAINNGPQNEMQELLLRLGPNTSQEVLGQINPDDVQKLISAAQDGSLLQ